MPSKVDRNEIIKFCSHEFMKKGYYGTSMSDLGQACGGMEKSHFYYYFKSKDALFLEVLNYLKNETINFIFAKEENVGGSDDVLSTITTRAYTFYTQNNLGCIFGKTALEISSLQNDNFNEVITDYFNIWHKALGKIYKEFYKKKIAKELAQLSIQDLQGALIMQQIHKNDEYIKKSLNRMFERILDGM